ncbi:MAG: Hsp20/alpha crystallin family protein [Solirubrobacterales bacterium]
MPRQRDLVINIERMRREMDELLGDPWGDGRRTVSHPTGFSPRVDVYYCREETPKAVIVADLAGVSEEAVNLELTGRRLVISGHRPVRETEGRAYQQVEIPTGRFRRVIELGVEIDASEAQATFSGGVLRVELPVRAEGAETRRVPIERTEG